MARLNDFYQSSASGTLARQARYASVLIWGLIVLAMGPVSYFVGIAPVATTVGNWLTARDYRMTTADVVTLSEKTSSGEIQSWLGYKYVVDDRVITGDRLTLLESSSVVSEVNLAAERELESAKATAGRVVVWVSPRNPEIAVMSREFPWPAIWARALFGVVFAFIALVGLIGLVGALFNSCYYRKRQGAAFKWILPTFWCGFSFPILMAVSSDPGAEFMVFVMGIMAMIGLHLIRRAMAATIRPALANDE